MELQVGQRVNLNYKGRKFEAVIINPHAFGKNKPSMGVNFRMAGEHSGISSSKLTGWTHNTLNRNPDDFSETDIVRYLELPVSKKRGSKKRGSKNRFTIHYLPFDENDRKLGYDNLTIKRDQNHAQNVIEVSEFIDLCFEVLSNEDIELAAEKKEQIADFLKWFAIEGFYAQAYSIIRGAYTKADSEELHQWLEARLRNKSERLPYARFIAETRETPAFWTDYTYLNLFGKIASEMRKEWATIEGTPSIARNHIPEALGLEVVGYVERMMTEFYVDPTPGQQVYDNLRKAHDQAIEIAQRKFKLPIPEPEDVNIDKLYLKRTLKLNPQQVEEIKLMYANGFSIKDIALQYNVTPQAISYRVNASKY